MVFRVESFFDFIALFFNNLDLLRILTEQGFLTICFLLSILSSLRCIHECLNIPFSFQLIVTMFSGLFGKELLDLLFKFELLTVLECDFLGDFGGLDGLLFGEEGCFGGEELVLSGYLGCMSFFEQFFLLCSFD